MTLRVATRRAALYPAQVAAASEWWLSGGIAEANVVAVWDTDAVSLATSLLDLSGNGNNATQVGTISWSTSGWSGFDNTNYLTTTVVPQSTYSMVAQWTGTTSGTHATLAGSYDTGTLDSRFYIKAVHSTTGNRFGYGDNSYIGSALTGGVALITPNSAYHNGSKLSDLPAYTFADVTAQAIWLGAMNASGSAQFGESLETGNLLRVAIYNVAVDSAQASLYAAMAAL